jgi:hypothetical protein
MDLEERNAGRKKCRKKEMKKDKEEANAYM